MVKLTALLLCAGCFLLTVAGQDGFDLADALDPGPVTKKPAPPTKRPPNNPPKLYPDLKPHGNGDNPPKLYPDLKPYGNGDDFNDLDLNDGNPPPANPPGGNDHISYGDGNTVDSSTTAQITSPIVVVAVLLVVGSIAGYNSYKQKTFCFKPRGGGVV